MKCFQFLDSLEIFLDVNHKKRLSHVGNKGLLDLILDINEARDMNKNGYS